MKNEEMKKGILKVRIKESFSLQLVVLEKCEMC